MRSLPKIMCEPLEQGVMMQPQKGVQSLERAFHLLELIAGHHAHGISQVELQHLSRLDRTTVHRMLRFLAQAHYVFQDPGTPAFWRLGMRSMGLGLQALALPPVIEKLRPLMKTLARLSNDNVFLICRMGDFSYTLHLEQGDMAIAGYSALVGATRLLGLGTASMALLAALPEQELQAHLQRHQPTYSAHQFSPLKLQRAIDRTRQLGYALASEPAVSGAGAAFALDGLGLVALSILSSRPRMPVARRHEMARVILQETQAFMIAYC